MELRQWAKEKFNVGLDDWQEKFILDNSPQMILKFGRKSGKTTAMALKVVWESGHDNWHSLILSRGQRQSSEVFSQVRQMFHIIGAEIEYETQTKIILKNGYTVYSLPSGNTGVTLRTYSFHKIYYDEAAYIPDEVYDATTPCLAVNGIQKIMASTPCGTSGFFYREWHNPEFKRYEGKTRNCSRVSKHFLLQEKRRMTKAQFAQEYDAEFTELADGLISSALIHDVMKDDIDWTQAESQAQAVFLGVDFARFGRDDNAIAYAFWDGQKARVRAEVYQGRYRLTSIVGRIRAIVDGMPKIKKIVTDETGIGGGPTDELVNLFGKRRVLGIQNQRRTKDERDIGRPSRYIKQDLYSNMIRMMENGKIELDGDIRILRSLRQIKYRYTKDGLLAIYGADSHIAEAIVRAVFPLLGWKQKCVWFGTAPHEGGILSQSAQDIEMDTSWETVG